MANQRIDLPPLGTLDLLILKALALESLHGSAISERLQQVSREALQVQQGSLYPARHRLERRGWIEAKWSISENSRRASTTSSPARARSSSNPKLSSGADSPKPSMASLTWLSQVVEGTTHAHDLLYYAHSFIAMRWKSNSTKNSVVTDRQAEKYRQSGLPPKEAMRRARIDFGGPEQTRRQSRDARGTRLVEDLMQDANYGYALWQKAPASPSSH